MGKVGTILKGRRGEELAAEFLSESGMSILEMNWRCGHKEIDIIAEDCLAIHFVEVRTLTAPVLKSPEESVDYKKRQKIIRAASAYMKMSQSKMEVCFDIVSIVYNSGGGYSLKFYPNAFLPDW